MLLQLHIQISQLLFTCQINLQGVLYQTHLNEFDKYVKHNLKIKYYLRYADDFIILAGDKPMLELLIVTIKRFLREHLELEPHPQKIIIRKLGWGIDFLGYIVLPYYRLPRTKTRRRISKKLKEKRFSENFNQSLQSYLGYLSHANSFKLIQDLENQIYIWKRVV